MSCKISIMNTTKIQFLKAKKPWLIKKTECRSQEIKKKVILLLVVNSNRTLTMPMGLGEIFNVHTYM